MKIHIEQYYPTSKALCGTKGATILNFWSDKATCLKCIAKHHKPLAPEKGLRLDVITVYFQLPNGKTVTREFPSPVHIDEVGKVGEKLGSHVFNAYEDGKLLGGWAIFKGGWSFCGRD